MCQGWDADLCSPPRAEGTPEEGPVREVSNQLGFLCQRGVAVEERQGKRGRGLAEQPCHRCLDVFRLMQRNLQEHGVEPGMATGWAPARTGIVVVDQ